MGVCIGKGTANNTQGATNNATSDEPTENANVESNNATTQQPKKNDLIKLLLLGAGESGKSTVWKQMKIIHLEGFSEEERDTLYKPAIVENVVQLLQGLLEGAAQAEREVDESNTELAEKLSPDAVVDYQEFKGDLKSVISLWEDKAIQDTIKDPESKLALDLVDSAPYWYEHYKRVLDESYIPSIEDIIKCRTKTTGISELNFDLGGRNFKLIDVGGQRSERKKWISCFQNLTCIIFVVALSEYDQTLREDSDVMRMQESMKLFRGVVANEALHHVSMIVFLNKYDIFKEKIAKTDLSVCFPDYTGGKDEEAAFEFMKSKFTSLNTNPDRKIYTITTTATDIKQIRSAMETVKSVVLEESVASTGL
eukprot:TRINITY_DN34_c1_g1_i1.p1 TRINITY_DN34_c1_g1~~TRINITY_DN34_c1_g1_i1.p1  ORF type:complete len:379 (-),score=95.62 TRINITY_DN34_c1_g1_i1:190-1290(-)